MSGSPFSSSRPPSSSSPSRWRLVERIDERAAPWERGKGRRGIWGERRGDRSLQWVSSQGRGLCLCEKWSLLAKTRVPLLGATFLAWETTHAEKGMGGKRPFARARVEGRDGNGCVPIGFTHPIPTPIEMKYARSNTHTRSRVKNSPIPTPAWVTGTHWVPIPIRVSN
uniref:Uncharacterized protein n=1 Tax=Oryza sativa subsp. japonica TaxID=39947 RepID=Q6H7M4_ORYSJ|nr:hypothetical protein [Oryza sativa Japonica Group]BAD25275.1 hypothetical protein [Oryza sativa Japonica Group]